MATYFVPYNLVSLPGSVSGGGDLMDFDAAGNGRIIPPGAAGQILVADGAGNNNFQNPAALTGIDAANVTYDNATSGLTATDVQAALDEIDATVDGLALAGGTFISHPDTPANYTGSAYLALKVNPGETALEFGGTDATILPSGTTAERPGAPVAGMIRYNSDISDYEYYDGASWLTVGSGAGPSTSMFEDIFDDGVDYTAGGGGPDTFALSGTHGNLSANVWVSFDGTDQFDGFNLIGGNQIEFPTGIPADVDQVRVKTGQTTAVSVTFDIDALSAGTPDATDLLVFSDQDDSGTEKKASIDSVLTQATANINFDIDSLPAIGSIDGTDLVAVSDGGVESSMTLTDFATSLDALGIIGTTTVVTAPGGGGGYPVSWTDDIINADGGVYQEAVRVHIPVDGTITIEQRLRALGSSLVTIRSRIYLNGVFSTGIAYSFSNGATPTRYDDLAVSAGDVVSIYINNNFPAIVAGGFLERFVIRVNEPQPEWLTLTPRKAPDVWGTATGAYTHDGDLT
jgi:hypothetical protein